MPSVLGAIRNIFLWSSSSETKSRSLDRSCCYTDIFLPSTTTSLRRREMGLFPRRQRVLFSIKDQLAAERKAVCTCAVSFSRSSCTLCLLLCYYLTDKRLFRRRKTVFLEIPTLFSFKPTPDYYTFKKSDFFHQREKSSSCCFSAVEIELI